MDPHTESHTAEEVPHPGGHSGLCEQGTSDITTNVRLCVRFRLTTLFKTGRDGRKSVLYPVALQKLSPLDKGEGTQGEN